jgi:antitoxin ChpS
LVISPEPSKRYTLEELLDASDYSQPLSPEDREWLEVPPVGKELI